MIRRLLLSLAAFFAIFVGSTAPVAAFDLFGTSCTGTGAGSAVCQEKTKGQSPTNNVLYGPNGTLMLAANILSFLVGIAAVIIIIISGIKYMLSQGDSGKIQAAKNTIIYAAVGLVVVVISRSLIAFIVTKL